MNTSARTTVSNSVGSNSVLSASTTFRSVLSSEGLLSRLAPAVRAIRPAMAWIFALLYVAASSAWAAGPYDGRFVLSHQDLSLTVQCGTVEADSFNVVVASVYEADLGGSTVLPADALAGLEAAWTAAIIEEDLTTRQETAALKAMDRALVALEKGINRGLSLLPETLQLEADEAVPASWLSYEATGVIQDASSGRSIQTPATITRAGGAFTLLPVALVKQGAQGRGSVASTLDLAGSLGEGLGQMRLSTQLLTTDPASGKPLSCLATTKVGFDLE